MNFIFFSPHFPKNSTEFCFYLHQFGANVLGIGDADYNTFDDRLKQSLTEYYRITDMENYDQVLRAVGYFTFKYGKIDRFESLNEYWLELEAKIRTDFNIYGTRTDFIENLKQKSKMKSFFHKSEVLTVKYYKYQTKEEALKFIEEVGYPIVVKPDSGAGANFTYKINDEFEFNTILSNNHLKTTPFILEEFVDGIILTYDGLINRFGNVVFENSHLFEQSIMNVVNTDDNLYYICLPYVDEEVRKAGRNVLKAFDVREKFFHIEFFRRKTDGKIVALEVNMRPPGAWMTDAMDFTYDINVYRKWAGMVVVNLAEEQPVGQYFTGYASRKDHKQYLHSHQDIMDKYGKGILFYSRIEEVFSRAMGNSAYQFRTKTYDEVKEIINYIQTTK